MDDEIVEIENFPEWAIEFAMYNDDSNLTEDEKVEVGYWMADNELARIVDTGDDSHFSKHPIFGDACNVQTVYFEKFKGQ